ncbi:tetratricopeptide repeat-containing sensor histidine kinase [Mucilaginibacter gilvus]|uniref:histidine kinase n=1 Tax=Mucilaginibacter gilvus TaxID=2305909 RepID=A0A3S4YI51_9SPHI|nr:histidine kinase dimerization/phosphoacceptor domain -containing protein [Mucilaginibacter gilvus]RWY55662.1 tetratricopeptide repeat protein [Mucilaginibacter gilvus]
MKRVTYARFLAFFVLLFSCLQAYSQTVTKSEGDRYMASAKAWTLKNDSAKCNADVRKAIAIDLQNGDLRGAAEAWLKMEEYYNFFHGADMTKRIFYYEQALPLFLKAGAKNRAAATLKILGDFYQVQTNYAKSLSTLKQSLMLYQATGEKDLRGVYDLLGTVNAQMGNYDEAIKNGLLAVRAAETIGDTTLMLCTIYNRIGVTYFNLKRYNQALIYFKNSLRVATNNHDINSIVLLSYNIANAMKFLNRAAESYKLMRETEKTYHPADLDNRILINVSCLNILANLKRYGEAKKHCDTLLKLVSKINAGSENKPLIEQTVALYFLNIKDFNQARIHALKFEQLGSGTGNYDVLVNAYKLQYKIDSAKADYPNEIRSYRRYIKLKDQLFNEKNSGRVAQLEIQYETEKKNQELKAKESNIAILKKQTQLQATAQKLYIAGTILLALLLGLSYNRYLLKQKVNRQLQVQQTEINLQNRSLTNLIAEKDNLLEEKEWLMKEIHHRVKNNLQIVISLLNTQSSYLNDDVAYKAIRESQHRMQSISLIHQKLYQSENLALVNMPAYIGDLVQYLTDSFDTASKIKFDIDIAPIELDVTKSVPLGLILNEAITNSIKYAFPQESNGKIKILLSDLGEGSYELQISDNGIGNTAAANLSKSKTLGMSLMRGLSKQLSGTFAVENRDGLTIIIKFVDEKFSKAIKNDQPLSS